MVYGTGSSVIPADVSPTAFAEPTDPNVKIVEITNTSTAMDGRKLDLETLLRPAVLATDRLLQDRMFKPPLIIGHTPDPIKQMMGLQQATDPAEQKIVGSFERMALREPDDREPFIQAELRLTDDGLKQFEDGTLTSLSVEIGGFPHTKDGTTLGPFIPAVAALGFNPAAFPETRMQFAANLKDKLMGLFDRKDKGQKLSSDRLEAFAVDIGAALQKANPSLQFANLDADVANEIIAKHAVAAQEDIIATAGGDEDGAEEVAETDAAADVPEEEASAQLSAAIRAAMAPVLAEVAGLKASAQKTAKADANLAFDNLVEKRLLSPDQKQLFSNLSETHGIADATQLVLELGSAGGPPQGDRLGLQNQGGSSANQQKFGLTYQDYGFTNQAELDAFRSANGAN